MDKYKKFKVTCAQLKSGNKFESNLEAIEIVLSGAKKEGTGLIVLPENSYFMAESISDLHNYVKTGLPARALVHCKAMAKKLKIWAVFHIIESGGPEKKLESANYLISDKGAVVCRYAKIHPFEANIPGFGRFVESTYLDQGNIAFVAKTPFGPIGIASCSDLRFPELFRKMAEKGAMYFAVPSAFTEYTGKLHWQVLLQARAIETGCFIFAPSRCGKVPSRKFSHYGHSMIVDPFGRVVGEIKKGEGIITAELEPLQVEASRRIVPTIRKLRKFTVKAV